MKYCTSKGKMGTETILDQIRSRFENSVDIRLPVFRGVDERHDAASFHKNLQKEPTKGVL